MSAPPATSKTGVRERRKKVSTRHVNHLPALSVRELPVQNVDLRKHAESLVCPACKTWVPISGPNSKEPKLVPHDAPPTAAAPARRCIPGTNRLVRMDMPRAEWERRWIEGSADANGIRSKPARRKPTTPAPPPVSRMGTTWKPQCRTRWQAELELLRTAQKTHLRHCRPCAHGRPCDGGRQLATRIARRAAGIPQVTEPRARRQPADC